VYKICYTVVPDFLFEESGLRVAAQMSSGVVYYCFNYIVLYRKQYLRTFIQLHEDLAVLRALLYKCITVLNIMFYTKELLYSLTQKIEDGTIEHNLLTSPGLLDIFKVQRVGVVYG
jgi:hypothetical protein